MIDTPLPSREELLKGCEQYRINEERDAMYKVATFLISHFWRNPTEVTNGLGVLLLMLISISFFVKKSEKLRV